MILIAIGANLTGRLGSPLATCRAALEALAGLEGLHVTAASQWYVTTPISDIAQPDYLNGVVRLGGIVLPDRLLASLQAIEARAGRERSVRNGPRTLDLDIIAIDDLVRDAPDPILPHPRAHERAFVLRPLADVAPGWRHPRLGRTVESLLADLPDQGVRPL